MRRAASAFDINSRGTAMAETSPAVLSDLAPGGKLRVGLNMSNFLLTKTDPATGKPDGLAADLGRELGRRLGVPVELVPYPNPGVLADAAKSGAWDVGFLGAEPQRATEIDFTAAYVEIEATYLVPPGSKIQSIAEVDREGVRIGISDRSAYELYLTRNLKKAQLVREKGGDNAFKRFVDDKLDAFAGLRPGLVTNQEKLPGSRILDGNFTAVQQAAGTPKGRKAGARYLREFIEEVKESGLVAKTIEKHGVRGLTVAAASRVQDERGAE
jgi:polar amino acid transport system substrate-binding protein